MRKQNKIITMMLMSTFILITVSFSGCTIRFRDDIYEYTEYEYEANEKMVLSASTINGGISISSHDTDTISLQIIKKTSEQWGESEFEKVDVEIQESGDDFIIETKHVVQSAHVSVSFIIKVPDYIKIDTVDAVNGFIVVSNIQGDSIQLSCSNGGITASDITGDIIASTDNGPIKATHINGFIEAHAGNAGMTIKDVKGVANLSSSNGPINAEISDFNDDISITTSNAEIIIHFDTELNANIEAKTKFQGNIYWRDIADYLFLQQEEDLYIRGILGDGGDDIFIETSYASIIFNKL